MISPFLDSASASARSLLPDAVGPTTTAISASPRSSSSTADFALQLIPSDSGHDGPAVRTVPREVDLIERCQERSGFVTRQTITGADRTMAGHRRENQVDG